MSERRDEVFGTPEQQQLLRRGCALREVVAGDPRYTYYGRTVGLIGPEAGDVNLLARLAELQGNSNYAYVPPDEAPAIVAELEARGLVPMIYERWRAGAEALARAEAFLADNPLPDDLTLTVIDRNATPETLGALAEVSLGCGVLPSSGAALRGTSVVGVSAVALDAAGRGVSCAASATYTVPDHPKFGGQAWWGMLATHPDRRGERLSLILGATVMLEMHARFGTADFFTGIVAGNSPSEAVSARLGLAPEGRNVVGVADPLAVPGGRMTK